MANNKHDIATTENFFKALEELNNRKDNSPQGKYFVYHKDNGAIVCITPDADDSFSEDLKCAMFEREEVYEFLSGDKSPSNYVVTKVKGTKNKFKLVEKKIQLDYLRLVDNFLTEIKSSCAEDPDIIITNNVKDRNIVVMMAFDLMNALTDGMDSADDSIKITGPSEIKLNFTLKHNPCFLLETINVSMAELLKHGKVNIEYNFDPENTSVFTKKIFENYTYNEVTE